MPKDATLDTVDPFAEKKRPWKLYGVLAAVLVLGTAVHLVRQAAARFRASAPLILEKAEPEEPSKN